MAGGRLARRPRRARRWAALLISGALTAPSIESLCFADETIILGDAVTEAAKRQPRPDERSIVVENVPAQKAEENADAILDLDVALATDQSESPLEPIADVSEYDAVYEPEFADPPLPTTEPSEPTLADPPSIAEASDLSEDDSQSLHSPSEADVYASDSPNASTAAPHPADKRSLRTASFNGVTPGVTVRVQVLESWGEPLDADVTAATLAFQFERFPSVNVDFDDDRVASIRVELPEPVAAEELIAKLGLTRFRPGTMTDEMGSLVSATYPEHGVTLVYSPDLGELASDDEGAIEPTPTNAVCEIVVRPLGAEAFIDRSHSCPEKQYAHRIADLETALQLDPASAECRHWLSELKLVTGDLEAAEGLAAEAVKLDETSDQFRLQWAKCLTEQARYEQAVEQTRQVLEGTTAPDIVRAEALEQMGRLAALGSKEVQERAIPLHNKAIELADRLAADDDVMLQAAARKVLLSAHLAIAERIAAGNWQEQDQYVAQWIERASGIAEQMIAGGEADVAVRLQVAYSALAAGGRLNPPIDPQLWIVEVEQAAAELAPSLSDSLARDELNWRLGLIYCRAAEIEHRRGTTDLALKYGEQAEAKLASLAATRSQYPDVEFVMGRLYFQIGAVHAVHRRDHNAACQWYDQAVASLLKPTPLTPLANPGQHGDALVSMGVSYWEIGQREKAYELTEAGTELINQGVTEGLLAADSLAVPQGNLNAMASALGKVDLASPDSKQASTARIARGRSSSAPKTSTRRNAGPASQPRMAQRRAALEADVQRR